MWRDPIVEEVRRIREDYAARFNFDLQAMHRDLKARQDTSGRKVVSFALKRETPIAKAVSA
jgi:hypothetical protein